MRKNWASGQDSKKLVAFLVSLGCDAKNSKLTQRDNNINNNNNNNNNNPETRKYWVDIQQGIVSSHGERDPL